MWNNQKLLIWAENSVVMQDPITHSKKQIETGL